MSFMRPTIISNKLNYNRKRSPFFFFMTLPCVAEVWVQSLGQVGPLEEEMATDPVSLPAESHEEPGRLWCMGWQRVRHA